MRGAWRPWDAYAAAIAHDFNNLLTVIIGNLELIGERVRDEDLRPLLRPALQAAEAGAAFNRRLLSLSGRRRLNIAPFAVNDRIRGFAKLLEAALGSTIALKLDLADDLWLCVADPCEFDNALLNLAMNSRDALPHGGEVTITTRNAAIEAAEGREDAARGRLRASQRHRQRRRDDAGSSAPRARAFLFHQGGGQGRRPWAQRRPRFRRAGGRLPGDRESRRDGNDGQPPFAARAGQRLGRRTRPAQKTRLGSAMARSFSWSKTTSQSAKSC